MDMRTAIIRIFECGSVSSACILRRQSALWSGASRAVFCLPSSGVSERFWYPPLLLAARLHFWISETACTGWSKSRRSETPNLHRGNSCSLNVSAPVYCCCNQGFRTSSGSLAIFATIRRASNAITALLRTGELAAAPRFLRCRPIPPRNNVGDKLFLDHGVGRQRVWESLT